MNAAAMAAGVASSGLFAAEAFPSRRGVGFAAACLTAVVPTIVSVGAAASGDGLAFALAAASLWVADRLLRRGLTATGLVAACGVTAADMLTRVSLAPAAAVVAGAAALAAAQRVVPPGRAVARRSGRPRWSAWARWSCRAGSMPATCSCTAARRRPRPQGVGGGGVGVVGRSFGGPVPAPTAE